jgi:hypothetical protein
MHDAAAVSDFSQLLQHVEKVTDMAEIQLENFLLTTE